MTREELRIASAWRVDAVLPWSLMDRRGVVFEALYDDDVRQALARRRQSLDIPDDVKPGWVGIPVDMPSPPPMPTGDDATRIVVLRGRDVVWRHPRSVTVNGDTVVCTVTLSEDADGNPTATVVRP